MKVLVPLARSELLDLAIPAVRKLLAAAPDAELHLLTVLDPGAVHDALERAPDHVTPVLAGVAGPVVQPAIPRIVETHGEAMERMRIEAEEWLQSLADEHFPGVHAEPHIAWSRHPARAIVRTADELDADVIVMATHGRAGVGRLIAGSQTEKVIRRTSRPVLVVGPEFES